MVIQKIGNIEIKIDEPHALVLLPDFLIVKYGDKEQIKEEFNKVKEKINNYNQDSKENKLTVQVVQLLNQYVIQTGYPTNEEIKSFLEDYAIVPLPNNQEEFERCINNSGYLKRMIKKEGGNGL